MFIGTHFEIALTETRFEATARAMMDAVRRLVSEGSDCCSFSNLIVGKHQTGKGIETESDSDAGDVTNEVDLDEHGLNPNQVRAVKSSENPLALVWGPPGIIKIPRYLGLRSDWFQALVKPL